MSSPARPALLAALIVCLCFVKLVQLAPPFPFEPPAQLKECAKIDKMLQQKVSSDDVEANMDQLKLFKAELQKEESPVQEQVELVELFLRAGELYESSDCEMSTGEFLAKLWEPVIKTDIVVGRIPRIKSIANQIITKVLTPCL